MVVALGYAWVALCATAVAAMCIGAWRTRESNNPLRWLGIIEEEK